jgi:hypothetical protein
MPTVSLNERGVVVRGCASSTPSIRTSRSLDSDGSGADMGVKVENGWPRPGSPVAEPYAKGDSVPVGSSSGVGLLRFFFPEDDSEPRSGGCVCWGVIAGAGCKLLEPEGVSSGCRASGTGCCSGAVNDGLLFLGGG